MPSRILGDKKTDRAARADRKFANSKPGSTAYRPSEQLSAAALLAFEDTVRSIDREDALFTHLCNTARRFLPFRQAFVLKRKVKGGALFVTAASSIAAVDRDAPMIRWIEKLTARLAEDVGLDKQHHFSLPAYCDDTDEEAKTYPFTEFLWTPLRDGADIVGGYIAVKETPWQNHEDATADRFARLYAHAWRAIKGSRRSIRSRLATRKRLFIAVFALFLVGAWPVSITALAPAEVSSLDPFIVAAPFDGVVREILVDQNAKVGPDDPLIAFEDIERRNAFEIAAEEEAVALARFARASQGGINNAEAKREIAIAKAELDLARAEKEYAADLLAKTVLTAERQGLAVYSDRRDWVGRPVAAGEAIMQLADPNRIRFAIDLPVKESLVLKEGARVKIFLDSDPLRPIEAKLTEASYQAQTDKRNILAYQLSAIIVDENYAPPRIGVQGTAQIHGDKAPLAYAVLRRPLSFLRQMTGW